MRCVGEVLDSKTREILNLVILSLSHLIGQSKYSSLILFLSWFLKYLLTPSVSFAVRFGSASQVLLLCQGTRDGFMKDVCFLEHSVRVYECVCGSS